MRRPADANSPTLCFLVRDRLGLSVAARPRWGGALLSCLIFGASASAETSVTPPLHLTINGPKVTTPTASPSVATATPTVTTPTLSSSIPTVTAASATVSAASTPPAFSLGASTPAGAARAARAKEWRGLPSDSTWASFTSTPTPLPTAAVAVAPTTQALARKSPWTPFPVERRTIRDANAASQEPIQRVGYVEPTPSAVAPIPTTGPQDVVAPGGTIPVGQRLPSGSPATPSTLASVGTHSALRAKMQESTQGPVASAIPSAVDSRPWRSPREAPASATPRYGSARALEPAGAPVAYATIVNDPVARRTLANYNGRLAWKPNPNAPTVRRPGAPTQEIDLPSYSSPPASRAYQNGGQFSGLPR